MRYITSDLAKVLGITTNTIRRYEDAGFLNPNRDSSNYRFYNDFDIKKAAAIRLYSKCGFSHSEISQMIEGSDEEILNCYQTKLDSLDAQIERLTRLRHWLKDNKQLISTARELDNDYIIMNCPALKYILFSVDSKLLTEKNRLESVKTFMYDAPEVQLIQIYRHNDIMQNKLCPYSGWAIKEQDIGKFHLEDFIANNKFVESYPRMECLYLSHHIPSAIINDTAAIAKIMYSKMPQLQDYLKEHQYSVSGDIVEFYVNTIGNTITLMECIPIKKTQ